MHVACKGDFAILCTIASIPLLWFKQYMSAREAPCVRPTRIKSADKFPGV